TGGRVRDEHRQQSVTTLSTTIDTFGYEPARVARQVVNPLVPPRPHRHRRRPHPRIIPPRPARAHPAPGPSRRARHTVVTVFRSFRYTVSLTLVTVDATELGGNRGVRDVFDGTEHHGVSMSVPRHDLPGPASTRGLGAEEKWHRIA